MILASNLFGDILTDLGAAVSGSLGIAPSGNINPERKHPSMFEPIHGSAPDITGKGIANPIGAIWAGALMLNHLGAPAGHDLIVGAIERVLAGGGPRTPDLGGQGRHARRDRRDSSGAAHERPVNTTAGGPERPDHRRSHEEAHALRVVGAGDGRSDSGRGREGLLVLDAGRQAVPRLQQPVDVRQHRPRRRAGHPRHRAAGGDARLRQPVHGHRGARASRPQARGDLSRATSTSSSSPTAAPRRTRTRSSWRASTPAATR